MLEGQAFLKYNTTLSMVSRIYLIYIKGTTRFGLLGKIFKKSSGEEQGVITHLCRLGRVLAPTLEHKAKFPNAESVRFELLLSLLRLVSPVSPTSC